MPRLTADAQEQLQKFRAQRPNDSMVSEAIISLIEANEMVPMTGDYRSLFQLALTDRDCEKALTILILRTIPDYSISETIRVGTIK